MLYITVFPGLHENGAVVHGLTSIVAKQTLCDAEKTWMCI